MALATAIAAAISWLLATPALGTDDVYVWRDQSGIVRFSTVRQPEGDQQATDSTATLERQPEAQVAVRDSKE